MSVSAYVAILHKPNQKLFYSKTLNLHEADVILIWGGHVFANVHHTTDTSCQAISLKNASAPFLPVQRHVLGLVTR